MINTILVGYLVNFLSLIFLEIYLFLSLRAEMSKDPKKFILLKAITNHMGELNRLKNMAPFQEKYSNLIAFLLPFAYVLKCYEIFYGIHKNGNFLEYLLSEIKRFKKLIGDKK